MIELAFFIYLISGSLKAILYAFGIYPVIDFTLLTAIVLAGTIVIRFFFNRQEFDIKKILARDRVIKIAPLLIFYLWCLVTVFYDRSAYLNYVEEGLGYPGRKAYYFLTCIVSLSVPMLFSNFNLNRFSKIYVCGTVVIALFFVLISPASYEIFFPDNFVSHRIIFIKETGFLQKTFPAFDKVFNFRTVIGNHLINAQLLGTSLLLVMNFKNSLGKALLFSLLIFLLISADGRGPTIIFIFCMLLYFFLNNRKLILSNGIKQNFIIFKNLFVKSIKECKTKSIIAVVAFNITILLLIISNPTLSKLYKKSFYRYLGIVEYADLREDNNDSLFRTVYFGKSNIEHKHIDTSILARELYIKSSVKMIFASVKRFFLGYGFGNYPKASSFALLIDDHPHNVLLEVFTETGLVGILLFGFFLFAVYKSSRHANLLFSITVLFIFLNTLKSVPLVDRNSFAFYALLLLYPLGGYFSNDNVKNAEEKDRHSYEK